MIICPNCNHQNPEGSVQCENCYTELPSTYSCPNCGALVQTDATFCGQCGFNLQGNNNNISQVSSNLVEENSSDYSQEEDLASAAVNFDSFQSPWDIEEEEEERVPEITEIEEEPLSFYEAESNQPPVSPFEEPEFEEPEFEEPEFEEPEAEFPSLVEEESLPEIPEIEEEPLSFYEVESSQPTVSPFEEPEAELPSLGELDDVEEVEELELWMSSVKEESPVENEEEIEEIPDFLASDDLETTAQFALSEEEVPEPVIPPPSIEEPEPFAEPAVVESNSTDIPTEIPTDIPQESVNIPSASSSFPTSSDASTRLQLQRAILFHTQTGNSLELPPSLAVIRIGKQNNQVPPDIDVSGFPNSEIVSRVHADIRVEGDTYFIEDRGSSNGTYINNSPLLTGNRHRLRPGDRISLGKGDLVTFLFQLS